MSSVSGIVRMLLVLDKTRVIYSIPYISFTISYILSVNPYASLSKCISYMYSQTALITVLCFEWLLPAVSSYACSVMCLFHRTSSYTTSCYLSFVVGLGQLAVSRYRPHDFNFYIPGFRFIVTIKELSVCLLLLQKIHTYCTEYYKLDQHSLL